MNRRDLIKAIGLGCLMPRPAPVAPPAGPEERDLAGMARLVNIYVTDAAQTPYRFTRVLVETCDGYAVDNVTKLELNVDAGDMLLKGHMTRIARDEFHFDPNGLSTLRPGAEPRLVREPVVVVRIVAIGPDELIASKPLPYDLAYHPNRGAES
jgi:hypothetical protein